MEARAKLAVWWPGIKRDIEIQRAACEGCIWAAPSQPSLPPVEPSNPDYPMQKICSDVAHFKDQTYVVIVDRFTNWASVYRANKAEGLIKALRHHFVNFGAPEELASDGGPEYTSSETREF